MLFSSLTFIFYFLPIFLFLYYIIPRNVFFKNCLFLLASLFFYFWGEKEYIYVLGISIFLNYLVGFFLGKNNSDGFRNYLLFIGIAINLLLLIGFKYTEFLIENLSIFNLSTGIENKTQIHLPLGISFFTFQGVSYLIDVYRREVECEKNFINLALYIAMFPQLVAGPIVRYKTISRSFYNREHTFGKFSHGVLLFIIGLGYKVLIANVLAVPVDRVFELRPNELSFLLSWIGITAYTLQIYFDFCGYSTMAIGLGLMLGFQLPKNFNFPYISDSITEFWRRWHITLSQWFRDYLYIPLGGNRNGKIITYRNLISVFLLCGIWHGASWNFLLWGVYHGAFLVLERVSLLAYIKRLPKVVRIFYALIVVMFGWVMFRADNLAHTWFFYKSLLGFGTNNGFLLPGELLSSNVIITFVIGIFLSTPVINWCFFGKTSWNSLADLTYYVQPRFTLVWYFSIFLILILCTANLANLSYNPFIYFRF